MNVIIVCCVYELTINLNNGQLLSANSDVLGGVVERQKPSTP